MKEMEVRGVGGMERQGVRSAELFLPPLSTVSSSKRSEHTLQVL